MVLVPHQVRQVTAIPTVVCSISYAVNILKIVPITNLGSNLIHSENSSLPRISSSFFVFYTNFKTNQFYQSLDQIFLKFSVLIYLVLVHIISLMNAIGLNL